MHHQLLLLASALGLFSLLPCPSRGAQAEFAGEQGPRVTTNRVVAPQLRRSFPFPKAGIAFDTDFDGARLSDMQQTGPASFTVRLEPENSPVNDSAWYAFRACSASNQTVLITLQYPHGRHRYAARLSEDGRNWRLLERSGTRTVSTTAAPSGLNETSGTRAATFTLEVALGPKPLFISAQELITSRDFESWISGLRSNAFVRSRIIGKSTLGKPLPLLEVSEAPADADLVLVLGRQHPPEVTGTLALQSFVAALCEDTPVASAFRRKFRLIVVPLLNPDGVDAGHWRHNAGGVDLNRDWGQFNQPETRRVSSELLDIVMGSGGRVRLGLDFHSTQKDVFYTSFALGLRDELGIRWLERLQQLAPEYRVHTEGARVGADRPTVTAASWLRRAFNAPAITYEVGDQTDRPLLRSIARKSALALIQVLSEEPREAPQPAAAASLESRHADGPGAIRVALYKGPGASGAGPGKILAYFEKSPAISVRPLSPAEIRAGKLRDFEVVLFPGGSASAQAAGLGEEGLELVRSHLRQGGGYVGICAGAYLACVGSSGRLQVLDAKTVSPKWQRGAALVGMQLTTDGAQLLRAAGEHESMVKYQNGPILMPAGLPEIEDYLPLARFTTEVAENGTPKGIMTGAPAAVAGTYAKGRVVCFSPHPEQTAGLEPLLESAIRWAASKQPGE